MLEHEEREAGDGGNTGGLAVQLAQEINARMPAYVADARETLTAPLACNLLELGADVHWHDPSRRAGRAAAVDAGVDVFANTGPRVGGRRRWVPLRTGDALDGRLAQASGVRCPVTVVPR